MTDYNKIIKDVSELMNKKDKTILDKVQETLRDRKDSHGDFKKNFGSIARSWSDYLDLEGSLSGKDVAIMMILLKVARIKDGEPREDDWIDIIGYANLGSKL